MQERNFYFQSQDGRTESHGMRWIPEGEVRAVVQICHGMSEYLARYRNFAAFLADRGVLVVGHDHLGHGGSIEERKDYGFFAEKNGNQILIQDIHRVYQYTRKDFPDIPYILLGHSMGSFLVRQYLCHFGSELDGAVLCGTGYYPYWLTRLGMMIAQGESALWGNHYRSRLLLWMSFGSYNAKFHPNRTNFDWISRDPAVVDAFVRDPECGFPFTVNGYYNLFRGMSKIVRPVDLARMPGKLPVLMIAGGRDPVGDFGRGVRKVENLFRQVGMEQVKCILYPEDRHEILNEPDRREVYEDIWEWMQKNCLRG